MCSLFGLIDFKECLSTHTKNKILNTLARECQVRGTDATGDRKSTRLNSSHITPSRMPSSA